MKSINLGGTQVEEGCHKCPISSRKSSCSYVKYLHEKGNGSKHIMNTSQANSLGPGNHHFFPVESNLDGGHYVYKASHC